LSEDEFMTTKEKMIQAGQELPDDASVEDAMERLLNMYAIGYEINPT
jgi:hypothetical protein